MLTILVFAIAIVSLVCWIKVLIVLFSKAGVGLGILGIICALFAFIWGWVKHKEYGLTKVMAVWTAAIVIMIPVNIMNTQAIIREMQKAQQQQEAVPAPAPAPQN
jgi:hypothetical protein